MGRRYKDESGKRYGRWSVIRPYEEDSPNGQKLWICVCDCGNNGTISGSELRKGASKSCGCLAREVTSARERMKVGPLNANYRHGEAVHVKKNGKELRSGLYKSWMSLRYRIEEKSYHGHHYYLEKGITHDPRWLSYPLFKDDMGDTWFQGAALHRTDPWKGYFKENCVWLSPADHGRIHQELRRRLRGEITTSN